MSDAAVVVPPIVSVDDHLVEPPDLFEKWLPAKFRDVAPKVVKLPWELIGWGADNPGRQPFKPASAGAGHPEADCWVFGDVFQFIPNYQASVGLDPKQINGDPMNFTDMKPAFYDAKARVAEMDVVNVDRSMCFPNSMRFCGQVFLWMAEKDPALALACVQAYNDWAVEEWGGDSGGRLLPVGLIPLWDPQLAAAEIRRNAARGVKALAFSELPAYLDLPSIHDKDGHWLPVIEACDETSTVICLHIGSGSRMPFTSLDSPKAVTISATSLNAQMSLADWLLSGLMQKYPSLKLSFSESQIGWIPFILERIDTIWRNGTEFAQLHPAITELPSSYMHKRVYGCFFQDDFGVAARDAIGIDQITFEGDYPHQDSAWPDTYKYLEKVLAGLPQEDVHKIARGNALEMLGIPDVPLIEVR